MEIGFRSKFSSKKVEKKFTTQKSLNLKLEILEKHVIL